MSDDAFHPSQADLARLAALQSPDPLLVSLADDAAAGGMEAWIGLLVNGMILTGTLRRPGLAAGEIDAERATRIGQAVRPEDVDDVEWDEIKEEYVTRERRRVDAETEARDALADADLAELDPETARGLVHLRTTAHLTLSEVRIYAPGQKGVTDVPVMRVPLHQVSGWWVNRSDPSGAGTFTLWRDPEA